EKALLTRKGVQPVAQMKGAVSQAKRATIPRKRRQNLTLSLRKPFDTLPIEFAEHFGIDKDELERIQRFRKLSGKSKLKAAREIIDKTIITGAELPSSLLGLAIEE